MRSLDETRKEINKIDEEMAKLFVKRMECSKDVAEYKKAHALPILDATREDEMINRNALLIQEPTIREYYINFLKKTIDLSKQYQLRLNEGMKVAYSGVEGAFAHVAAQKMFPNTILVSYPNFNDAYNAVVEGECDSCVLPVENSYAGDVGTVMDLIFSGPLYINQMLDLEIVQNLIAKENTTLTDIKTVISHPQALEQCHKYLNNHHFATKEAVNTALAAKEVASSTDNTIAAVASSLTASLYGLKIIDHNINTKLNNTTRFAAFSRFRALVNPKVKMGEHFILVFTVLNEAGSLAKTLNIIGSHGFNMRNLRSRPMKELMWNYYFYVELDGNIDCANGQEMLVELSSICDHLKLVGTYYSHAEK